MKTIYYCISTPPTHGGQYVNAEHVVELRKLGLRAYLLYIPAERGRIERFSTDAPVIIHGPKLMAFLPGDVIVVGEAHRKVINSIRGLSCMKIVHCQNPYFLFRGFDDITALHDFGCAGILSCSGHTSQILAKMGCTLPIHTVRPAIPPDFSPVAGVKPLQIAYMPRKRANEIEFLIGLFRSTHPEYRLIPWAPISNMPRAAVANIMQSSSVFASLSFTEGLGLPPLEAMACGCVVAGFDGLGGQDYANAYNGYWVSEGDYFGYVQQLVQAIEASQSASRYEAMTQACTITLSRYSQQNFRDQLTQAWRTILGSSYGEYLLGAN